MRKLIEGIVKFRREMLPGYKETFAKLALGQKPDALYIGCSDSRVAVNVFASTDPGDLFVVRNVGNLVPPYDKVQLEESNSVAAAIEFALTALNVSNIIVCGHSECGGMQALARGLENVPDGQLLKWLRHGEVTLKRLEKPLNFSHHLERYNQLSQLNVLQQLDHLATYPQVKQRLDQGSLRLHAWWFELNKADVYAYEEEAKEFILIDELEAARIFTKLGEKSDD